MTKEELVRLNASQESTINNLRAEDERLRRTFSELLDSYEWEDQWGGGRKRKPVVQSWEGIAFLIGELKSDADYSCVLEAREHLRRENQSLREEIEALRNPDKVDPSRPS